MYRQPFQGGIDIPEDSANQGRFSRAANIHRRRRSILNTVQIKGNRVKGPKLTDLLWKPTVQCFSGTPAQILEWFSKRGSKLNYCFEVVAKITAIYRMDTIILIGICMDGGPILKMVFDEGDTIHASLEIGRIVRCFGVKYDSYTLRCFKIRESSEDELAHFSVNTNLTAAMARLSALALEN